jgi:tetratricopeptide (TPR) repeat protein
VGTLCAACQPVAGAPGVFAVSKGTQQWNLDRAAVIARLRTEELRPTDFVIGPEGRPIAIAAHPEFREYYIPGSGQEIVPLPKQRRPLPPWIGQAFKGLVALALLGAAAGYATTHPEIFRPFKRLAQIEAPALPRVGSLLPEGSEVMGIKAVPKVDEPKVDPMDAIAAAKVAELTTRVGPVEEPRLLWIAKAWSARQVGTDAARVEATQAAEHAVARSPEDPDALSLLVEVSVEGLGDAAARDAALHRARQLVVAKYGAGGTVALRRAEAAVASLAPADVDAMAAARACLELDPTDLGCRSWEALASIRTDESAVALQRYDELIRDWPSNAEIVRRAALVAVDADAPNARARLVAARKHVNDDPQLESAAVVQLLRDGNAPEAQAIMRKLGKTATDVAAVAFAEAAALGGDLASIEDLFEGRSFGEGLLGRRAALARAQAAWRLARQDAGRMAEAVAAAEAIVALGARDALSLQARALIGSLAGDAVAVQRAWALMETKDLPARDAGRILLSQAWVDWNRGQPRDALPSVEAAIRADPVSPLGWAWLTQVQLASHNPAGALKALRDAVPAVNGMDRSRSPLGGALAPPPPGPEILDGLVTAIGGDARMADHLTFSRGAAAWLIGDDASALALLAPVAGKGEDVEAMALVARLELQRGRADVAVVHAERLAQARPKEAAYHLLRAQCYIALKRWPDAEKALAVVGSSGQDSALVQELRAKVALASEDRAAALVAARRALEMDRTDLVARDLARQAAGP